MPRSGKEFQTIHSEGGLLPPDLLRRVVDPKSNLPGIRPEDYGLPQGERINEAITQSWNRMCRHWAEFRKAAKNLPENEPGTGLTNDKWSVPLLRELGFGLLPTSPGPEINGRTYAINRFFGPTAIHFVGCGVNLDRRATGVRGAAATNPHGLVQEFLNRSPGHLWAIVSNGLRFRVLRDNQALSRQSYLEFDLEAMFTGEVFPDFVLLWLMSHATRFAPQGEGRPETCWLEQWTKVADEEGTRALGDLRAGVEKALQILGEAFVSHPRNTALREALRGEQLSLSNFHGQLLRVVYRLIFLFVAEDRTLDGISLLHPRDDSEAARQARERYAAHYSTARLRDLAGKIKGSRHGDLWQQFNLLVGALSGDARFETARQQLALPVLGSFLWSPDSTSALNAANLNTVGGVELANADFLEALRHLAFTRQGKVLRPVDYKNLGAEELGGVYESLLALTPQISGDGNRFTFAEFAGNERKTSGSYYTPDSLVQCLLDSALDPVVEEALKGKSGAEAEKAILALKVCDPAVGSGHFLVGAAHRLARHLARVRANAHGESEPSPLLYQHALRDVIGRCLYGVDINPMSAELCRVGLWLEALEPGKPLSFLDHHIQVGNSLLGTTPALLKNGIPDDAFTPIEGDVKAKCAELKRDNKRERQEYKSGQGYLFDPPFKLGNLAAEFAKIDDASDETSAGILEKEKRYAELVKGQAYQFGRLLADTWCAAFVWKKDGSELGNLCPTERCFRKVESHAAAGLLPHVRAEVERLRDQYQFFHWHLAFPDVFRLPGKDESPENEQTGWSGGFDVVLGNPPWERTAFEEVPYFLTRAPHVAQSPTTAIRQSRIRALAESEPSVYEKYVDDRRAAVAEDSYFTSCGRFPDSAGGRTNTYALFADIALQILARQGCCGMVLPTGVATDTPMQNFWNSLATSGSVQSLYDFENRGVFFPNVHSSYKFSLVTLTGNANAPQSNKNLTRFGFFLDAISDIHDPNRVFEMSVEEMRKVNPVTGQPPVCRFRREFEILRVLHSASSNIGSSFPAWVALTSAGTSGDWIDAQEETSQTETLDFYEAKMIHQFDHRFATYATCDAEERRRGQPQSLNQEKCDPHLRVVTRFRIPRGVVVDHLSRKSAYHTAIPCYRDVARSTDERTAIAAILPFAGLMQPLNGLTCNGFDMAQVIVASLNSFVIDFAARLKTPGIHLNVTICNQLPFLREATYRSPAQWDSAKNAVDWLLPRVLELTYTAWDLEPFARDCGYAGPPFRWDEDRRFLLRAELDAAFFHLYLPADPHGDWSPAQVSSGHAETPEDLARLKASFPTPRHAVDYILETFPIVRRKDEEKYNGDYRTKRVILEIYDAMAEAISTGQPYQTILDPPPADPRVAHPDTRKAVTLSEEQVLQSGRITAYVVLLLREWNRPAARNALEAALVLMLNDRVRQQILNQSTSPTSARASSASTEFVRGFDGFLQQLATMSFIKVETVSGTQAIRLGTNAPSTDAAPDEDRTRLRETLKSLEIVGEDRARDVLQEIVTESYVVVS